MTLSDFLVSEIFTFLLIFCRVGTAMTILPGFGESFISPRFRLLLAAMFSLVLAPLFPSFPPPPATIIALLSMIIGEIAIGLFIGTIGRMLLASVSTAGMIIAYQSGLASALVQDVTLSGGQGSSMGNLLSISVMVLIFATDMHHMMLRALVDSYQLFEAGTFPSIADMSAHLVQIVNASFLIALQLAAPHLVIGILVYLAGGIIGRLMPNLQIFSLLAAPQLLLSFFILMIVWNSLMSWYMDYFQENMMKLMGN